MPMLSVTRRTTPVFFLIIHTVQVTALTTRLMSMRSLWRRVMQLSSLPACQQAQPRLSVYLTVSPRKHHMSARYVITPWLIWHLAVVTLTATIASTNSSTTPSLRTLEEAKRRRTSVWQADDASHLALTASRCFLGTTWIPRTVIISKASMSRCVVRIRKPQVVLSMTTWSRELD